MRSNFSSVLSFWSAIAALSGLAVGSQDAQVSLMSNFVCEHPPYKVHLVSSSPLVIYIADFLTERERAHLQKET
jgi:prolyl 4-hydroxylase